MESKEYRMLGICKYCQQKIYGTHHNKYQSHQRWCLKNPNRNKALSQIKSAGIIGNKISNANRIKQAKIINAKYKHEVVCKKCGKTFEIMISNKDFENGNYRKYCSYKCSNSHNVKLYAEKIGNSVKKEREHICPKCGKTFIHKGTNMQTLCDNCFFEANHIHRNEVLANKKIERSEDNNFKVKLGNDVLLHKCKCAACNKILWVKTSDIVYCYDCCKKFGKIVHQLYNAIGKKIVSNDTRKKLKDHIQQRIKDGKHLGWMNRSKQSYPERFWQSVLENNNIKFQREVQFIYDNSRYYFDFVIVLENGKKLDLEIDGKQHYYDDDRLHHDAIRDKRARECGYLVYRIRWNNMTKRIGKLQMKAKIQQFLWWLDKVSK